MFTYSKHLAIFIILKLNKNLLKRRRLVIGKGPEWPIKQGVLVFPLSSSLGLNYSPGKVVWRILKLVRGEQFGKRWNTNHVVHKIVLTYSNHNFPALELSSKLLYRNAKRIFVIPFVFKNCRTLNSLVVFFLFIELLGNLSFPQI